MELALDYRIYKSYTVEQKIGQGVYGEVYRAVEKSTGRTVAIKKIIDAFQNLTDAKRTYRELAYMMQLDHPCIVKLDKVIIGEIDEKNIHTGARHVYAVMDIMEIDLAKVIKTTQLELLQRKYIAMQMLYGLSYLHSSELIHRDIKPSNILLDTNCTSKICDFGLVRKVSDFSKLSEKKEQIFTEYVASKWYRAPELMLSGNQNSTYAIDIWSAGCVMAEMILGEPLFTGTNTIDQLEKIFMIIGIPLESELEAIGSEDGKYLVRNFRKVGRCSLREVLGERASAEEIELIEKMLVFEPGKRITAGEALKHRYFEELGAEKEKFQFYPVRVVDHSEKREDADLQVYRELIESLSVGTRRGVSSSKSKESLVSNLAKNQNYFECMKYDECLQEKSTRESHSGMLRSYLNQKEKQKAETEKPELKKTKEKKSSHHRERNKSNQSVCSSRKKSQKKSKSKIISVKSSENMKYMKHFDKNFEKVNKGEGIKITKKKKKVETTKK